MIARRINAIKVERLDPKPLDWDVMIVFSNAWLRKRLGVKPLHLGYWP